MPKYLFYGKVGKTIKNANGSIINARFNNITNIILIFLSYLILVNTFFILTKIGNWENNLIVNEILTPTLALLTIIFNLKE
jgi:hypothetical protein